ncbi:DUF4276 family protein [Rhizohabitans arisaemae]|uniref:DUF4276 family protein n=1 Tax=Rhizohabitans arisaemae TaxID=2720610 RepID=UPI0024B12C0A|nr:DUF4276 family protein [Rhizohabitans arisaemae]
MNSATIVTIVEGHGEVAALPTLLRRLVPLIVPGAYANIPQPYRVPRNSLIKRTGVETAVTVAMRGKPSGSGLMVLIDADDDCPVQLAISLKERIGACRSDVAASVVIAKREFEAWFLAAAPSLAGVYGFADNVAVPTDPEGIRGAKERLSRHFPPGLAIDPMAHQAGFTKVFDVQLARANSPSFDKFWRDLEFLIKET